jgi:valyl-tRNA synthetase
VSSGKGLRLTKAPFTAWLDIDSETARRYASKLEGIRTDVQGSISRLEGRLSNESYVKNAPKQVVEETKKQLEEEKERLAKLTAELQTFSETDS